MFVTFNFFSDANNNMGVEFVINNMKAAIVKEFIEQKYREFNSL
jgi:hypothetical protein